MGKSKKMAVLPGEPGLDWGKNPYDYWITKSGTKVLIREIEDSHLDNAIKMMETVIKVVEAKLIGHRQSLQRLRIEKNVRKNAQYEAELRAKKIKAAKELLEQEAKLQRSNNADIEKGDRRFKDL